MTVLETHASFLQLLIARDVSVVQTKFTGIVCAPMWPSHDNIWPIAIEEKLLEGKSKHAASRGVQQATPVNFTGLLKIT